MEKCLWKSLWTGYGTFELYDGKLVNVKFALEAAMKAQGGVDVYLYYFFNLGAR